MVHTAWKISDFKPIRLIVTICMLGIIAVPVQAETKKNNLSDESMNPLSTLIALPFENNTLFNVGPSKSTANVLNIKPMIPISIGEWNIINRFTVPIVWSEGQEEEVLDSIDWGGGNPGSLGVGSAFGLADITYQGFFTPSMSSGSFSWGVGGALVIPTHTEDRFGTDKWSAGPAAVAFKRSGNWILGMIVQNVWSFAGSSDAADVNSFSLQYTVNYKLNNGYYLTTAPLLTANWESEPGNRWAVPFGGGVGRLVKFGKQPVAIDVGAYYYVERPKYNPDWYVQILFNFLFPKH